jgi:tetratricopeptide (TPR) repeat protein
LALPHFEAALQTMPEAAVHNETAVALLLLNRTEEAIGHFKSSLALSRDQPLVHYNLGLALQRLERWEEALAHLDAAAPFDEDARRAAARVRAFLRR